MIEEDRIQLRHKNTETKTQFINLEKKFWQSKSTSDQTILAQGERISGLQRDIEQNQKEIQTLKMELGFGT